MGPKAFARLLRHGFFPAGGGCIEVEIIPEKKIVPIDMRERGDIRNVSARALVARLPRHIAERELSVIKGGLSVSPSNLNIEEIKSSAGPGNAVLIEVESEHITEIFTAIGQRGISAETVAAKAVQEAQEYLSADVPVAKHLADQLLLPMALAGGGSFRTLMPTKHFTTNVEIIRRFLPVSVEVTRSSDRDYLVEISTIG
jgi:RNA 3'-terminal phosphate cyclase (ATP)